MGLKKQLQPKQTVQERKGQTVKKTITKTIKKSFDVCYRIASTRSTLRKVANSTDWFDRAQPVFFTAGQRSQDRAIAWLRSWKFGRSTKPGRDDSGRTRVDPSEHGRHIVFVLAWGRKTRRYLLRMRKNTDTLERRPVWIPAPDQICVYTTAPRSPLAFKLLFR